MGLGRGAISARGEGLPFSSPFLSSRFHCEMLVGSSVAKCGSPYLSNARPARVCQYRRANVLELARDLVTLDGSTDLLGAGGAQERNLGLQTGLLCLPSQVRDTSLKSLISDASNAVERGK